MADLLTSDIVTAVRAKLSDTAFDQTMIIDAMNAFVAEIYHNTRTRRMETYDQIFGSAGDTTADLPDDIDIRINLSVTSGPPSVYDFSDKYYQYGDFMKAFPKWQTDQAAYPYAWTDFGNQMRFSNPLLTATTFDIDYCRVPTAATVTSATPTDSIELDAGYKELAVRGTFLRCQEANEDYAEASNEANSLAPLITSWIRNEARGGGKTGPTIIRSNRNRGSRFSSNRLQG